MVDNGDSANSFAASGNDLFSLHNPALVDYSNYITVFIMTFLIRMSVLAGQGAPESFSTKFSMNTGLNTE